GHSFALGLCLGLCFYQGVRFKWGLLQHGMGFRLIGEGFACAPSVETVVLSGFTQVTNAATGRVEDKYLYSVKVKREAWGAIHFGNLGQVDPVEALAAFELRRDMTKTGIFRAIAPWDN
ncbi:hypothetical protein ACE05B_21095, partial [Marinobacter shengliensis]